MQEGECQIFPSDKFYMAYVKLKLVKINVSWAINPSQYRSSRQIQTNCKHTTDDIPYHAPTPGKVHVLHQSPFSKKHFNGCRLHSGLWYLQPFKKRYHHRKSNKENLKTKRFSLKKI